MSLLIELVLAFRQYWVLAFTDWIFSHLSLLRIIYSFYPTTSHWYLHGWIRFYTHILFINEDQRGKFPSFSRYCDCISYCCLWSFGICIFNHINTFFKGDTAGFLMVLAITTSSLCFLEPLFENAIPFKPFILTGYSFHRFFGSIFTCYCFYNSE